ncbi:MULTISPECIES: hypothetical protein [Okeania]|uniref:hypothetical protein n=1 Tax=Okeania TaxID=1458928 RepID=UPI00137529E6|nr:MULTISPECIES: hypothetical protein [Okeania]NET12418.1 hypothetical protein [Okeania sp. SIO1H6]NES75839.1 hypothetical protein [Okeania sp. SIO1H4]NES92768.1 hypothetical protein [Okeania sp. SIO2B9]NET20023.1 hypothetical protein [Okeania sp. SIO1H5]NET75533.1 hypothetical protein [Okeania sp. SIO1F9]
MPIVIIPCWSKHTQKSKVKIYRPEVGGVRSQESGVRRKKEGREEESFLSLIIRT